MKAHPFKQYDGMTVDGSTVAERQEIYDLLYKCNLIPLYSEAARSNLDKYSIIFTQGYFLLSHQPLKTNIMNNIPYSEFKRILSEL